MYIVASYIKTKKLLIKCKKRYVYAKNTNISKIRTHYTLHFFNTIIDWLLPLRRCCARKGESKDIICDLFINPHPFNAVKSVNSP